MIKIIVFIIFCLVILMAYSLCVAAANGDKGIEECKYNILEGCEGKCCRKCELENTCKLTCSNNPESCGGRH
ncbi:hypothetical protein [Clostridium sp. HMP27]|uniref:hypothetical protein n=1 Tax=Clostridium sp. HMP27 TaxID=1487921 RepID=UPI00052D28F8|nr:hypothetical protein [Clostridium sp. HMP27]KGK88022.1 hypothetical protein DP68_08810 [Clostridium sp. HMP27]